MLIQVNNLLNELEENKFIKKISLIHNNTYMTQYQMNFSVNCDQDKNYSVSIQNNLFDVTNLTLQHLLCGKNVVVITTPTVNQLFSNQLNNYIKHHHLSASIHVLDVTELSKTIEAVSEICEVAIKHGINRKGVLVAFGGGVCSDVVTVAASLIRRGIGCIKIPTTLIGQIDASIGIKGAVNFANKKSYLGCFYPTENILIDKSFLQSLPKKHIVNGLSEIIKMAILRDNSLFKLVENNFRQLIATGFDMPSNQSEAIITLAIKRMLEELEPNIYENKSLKRLVDFGHSFSPAIEAATNFVVSHGEAVAIDMALSTIIAKYMNIIHEDECYRIINLLISVGLPIYDEVLTKELCYNALDDVEKHRAGNINLVVPIAVGSATFLEHKYDISETILLNSIDELKNIAIIKQKYVNV